MSAKRLKKVGPKPMTEKRKAEIAEIIVIKAAKENGGNVPTYAELCLYMVRTIAEGFFFREGTEADARDCSEALGIPLAEAAEFLADIAFGGSELSV